MILSLSSASISSALSSGMFIGLKSVIFSLNLSAIAIILGVGMISNAICFFVIVFFGQSGFENTFSFGGFSHLS